jgi:nucleosome binding factor SPN SPT16 subunit
MADIDKLRADYERAEAHAHSLQAQKDEAAQKLIDKYRDRQRDANQKAAEAQKALCDAEAGEALRERHAAAMDAGDESEAASIVALASNLGLSLNV